MKPVAFCGHVLNGLHMFVICRNVLLTGAVATMNVTAGTRVALATLGPLKQSAE